MSFTIRIRLMETLQEEEVPCRRKIPDILQGVLHVIVPIVAVLHHTHGAIRQAGDIPCENACTVDEARGLQHPFLKPSHADLARNRQCPLEERIDCERAAVDLAFQ